MKIPPRKYSLALLEALEESKNPEEVVKKFLRLLWRKKQFRFLPKILRLFEKEWNKKKGIIKLNVWCPEKFIDTAETLKSHLEKSLQKEVEMKTASENKLLGGYQILFEDLLIDASVSGQLKRLKEKIVAAA